MKIKNDNLDIHVLSHFAKPWSVPFVFVYTLCPLLPFLAFTCLKILWNLSELYIYLLSPKKPSSNGQVQISEAILLDEEPPELQSLEITSGGRLVWAPDTDITLRVHYITVDGSLEIGSEDCLFTGPARIYLTGTQITVILALIITYGMKAVHLYM